MRFHYWSVALCAYALCLCRGTVWAQNLMGIWDFGPNAANYTEAVSVERVLGTPTFYMTPAGKDFDGANGVQYSDVEGTVHTAGQCCQWSDTYVASYWEVTLDMRGWQDIGIRWDYNSDNSGGSRGPTQFDLSYRIGAGTWVQVINDQSMSRDDLWHAVVVDLSAIAAIENQPVVTLRMHDLQGTTNGKFNCDNIEVRGTRIPTPIQIAFAPSILTDPPDVSGVIGDPTDPASLYGIAFSVGHDTLPPSSVTVTAQSDHPAVVPNDTAHLILTGTNADRNLQILPAGVGQTTITLLAHDGQGNTTWLDINYRASAQPAIPEATRYHTGMSDASTAFAVDADYMFVANDEDQPLRLFLRNASGLPVNAFDFTSNLIVPGSGEVDIEASMRVGNRIFWIGSHGNGRTGDCKPNRRRLFATDITGTGENASLAYVGRYDGLREDLRTWDGTNQHGLGANFFGLTASSDCPGLPPEHIGGFNIEGMTMGPDGTTAYIAFRAPIIPAATRTLALIVTIPNFQTWFNNGVPAGTPTFGAPIQLNLGGRGIRSIDRNANNEYLIVAGSWGETGPAPNDFRMYRWTGYAANAPELLGVDLTSVIAQGGSIESIVEVPTPLLNQQVQVLTDEGDTIWYNDGQISKSLGSPNWQKFRSDWVMLYRNLWYVSPSGNNTSGQSWATAFNNLRDALAAASSGDQIWIAAGTYKPDRGVGVTLGDRTATFQLINGVSIYGGFPHGGTWFDRDPVTNITTLSGDLAGNDMGTVLDPTRAENGYHVVTASGTNSTAILDGVTITAGNAPPSASDPYRSGAGIYNSAGNPLIKNCIVRDNVAYRFGGGMYNLYGGASIIDCTFSGNMTTHPSSDGGGLYNEYSNITVAGCTFIGNSAWEGESGGGICNIYSNAVIDGCLFQENDAYEGGGGVYNYQGSVRISNCFFVDNFAEEEGGGVSNHSSSPIILNCVFVNNTADSGGGLANQWANCTPTIKNCTFYGNTATWGGGGIYSYLSNPTLINCILWGNSDPSGTGEISQIRSFNAAPAVTYCCIQDDHPNDASIPFNGAVNGNIDDNPLLDIDGFHLTAASPCVNMGDPAYVPGSGETDIDGQARVQGGRIDIGADERPSQHFYVSPAGSNSNDGLSWGTAFLTIQYGVSSATHGDIVEVAQGTYTETVDLLGKNIVLTSMDPTNASVVANTIINANSSTYGVYIHSGEAVNAAVKGFTVKNAYYNIRVSSSHAMIANCVTLDAYYYGISCSNSTSRILDSTVKSVARTNYGFYCYYGPAEFTRCISEANYYGFLIYGSSAMIQNCSIRNNSSYGIYTRDGATVIRNSIIYGSSYGIWCSYTPSPVIRGVTIANNSTYGIVASSGCVPDISNSIIWANGDDLNGCTATYSNIEDGDAGAGNICEDPKFVNAGARNYHLQNTSPCINRGNPAVIAQVGETDIDNQARVQRNCIDMGADETALARWFVSTSGSDTNNGLTPATAFRTIQHGINAASAGEFVEVAQGTYYERISYNGKAITVQSSSPENWSVIDATVIDGSNGGAVVTFSNNEYATSVIKGFTITHGNNAYGPGINAIYGRPSISFCRITNNTGSWGGGIYFWGTSYGGGSISHCIITNNSAQSGGGIYFGNYSIQLHNCIIANNTASNYGGGIYNGTWNSIRQCTIYGNSAYYGGGIYLASDPCDLVNSILWANTATGSGPQIYRSAGQGGNIQYCDIQGGWTGTGNINVDPSLNASYHLNVGSPCMEAGNNSYATGTKDIDAQTRVYDGDGNGTATVDMGADEYRP